VQCLLADIMTFLSVATLRWLFIFH
jgi:hypothetical protein